MAQHVEIFAIYRAFPGPTATRGCPCCINSSGFGLTYLKAFGRWFP